MWRLSYFILIWFFIFIIGLIAWAVGIIVIPVACVCKAYVKAIDESEKENDKRKDGSTYHFTWFFMWPWDNESSDGIACRNYYESSFEKYGYFDMIVTTFVWSAIRNPINNLKRLLSPKYDFKKLKHIGSRIYAYKAAWPCWYLIWQGPFAGFYRSFMFNQTLYYIKIGYKLRNYSQESAIPESQKEGVGFTFRLIPKRIF